MADGDNANCLSAIGQLVDDPVGANPQRRQTAKLPPECVAGEWIALQHAERILDRVDQRPAQLQQVTAGSPSKDESGQWSAGGRPALGKFAS